MKVIKDTPLVYTKLDIYMKVIKDTPLVYTKLDIYVFITNCLRQIQIRAYLNINSNELFTKKQIRIQMYSLFLK
jgi:hypothetical protein